MAGSPKKRALLLELTKRAREMFGAPETNEPEPGPVDYVCGYIASGGTLYGLAAELKISRNFLKDTIELFDGVEGRAAIRERVAHARTESADAMAESGISITDNSLGLEKSDILANRIRAERRAWLAGKFNRAQYGDDKAGVQVTISLPSLHLQALQHVRALPTLEQTMDTVSVAALPASTEVPSDYEIIDDKVGSTTGSRTVGS